MSNEELENPEDVQVTLKPILGIDPRVYVPVGWGLALLVVLFFVLVFPGMRHHGSLVTVVVTPPDASLVVDSVRLGTVPGTHFVESGTREIEIRRPGFVPYRERIEVPGRVVGSWIFPQRTTLAVTLRGADPQALSDAALHEFSSWSLTGEASGQYQFPPIARALAADLRAAGRSSGGSGEQDVWEAFVRDALPHVGSEALLNDLAAGALSMGGETAVAVPSGIATLAQQLGALAATSPYVPVQVAKVLASSRQSRFAGHEVVRQNVAEAAALADLVLEGSPVIAGSPVRYPLGLEFVRLPGGDVVLGGESRAARGGDIPYRATLAPFSVSTTEIPFSAYEAFLDANPHWRPENRTRLEADGLVDGAYLSELATMRATPSLPVTGVSAYAAEAFARWYSGQLPAGVTARVPTEAQWDFVYRVAGEEVAENGVFAGNDTTGPLPVSSAGAGRAGIVGLLGNVWEWTADPFAPYAHVHFAGASLFEGGSALAVAHRVVRGGGWATDRVGFQGGDRGSLDPAWCSPFTGFRLVLTESR